MRQIPPDTAVEYKLNSQIALTVPLSKVPWVEYDLRCYEQDVFREFCARLQSLASITLIDCGADIGTFSCIVCSRVAKIERVFAFEPNPDVQMLLRRSLSTLPAVVEVIPEAVSNFSGSGRLAMPDYDDTDHGRFLVPGPGPLRVSTVDNIGIRSGNVAIKIDIEGGELEALQGSTSTIESATNAVVAFEAHPRVAARIGRDPVECVRMLRSIRPFDFLVAETGQVLSGDGPILTEGQSQIWNIVGWTR